ncbi:Glutathione S-transferase L2, chloroplastic -like protein [Gossypium arboreum]|uniref:Glutathione S-transferase L2, chloroplastic-like protein n=1 Tax=Gossypium arboreum TaxID=29729 RepID=A0A0B0NYX6_GOSAR|nr:Glutathione S-transferase L2, chloroplastic -like protein [Gossypium arboreum]
MAVCYISGIGFGPSATFQDSPNRTIPFSSNQITTAALPRTKALSCFHHATTSVQPTFSFHCKTRTQFPFRPPLPASNKPTTISSAMSSGYVQEDLPPALDSTSDPPPIFDGTTRLYISYTCPYAQRVWITRNCKGLQDKIKLVPIDLKNRPTWYKENVYPPNKVPALEHNNEVKGESLDLIKYIDSHFEGPSLFPDDPAKKQFADELLSYIDSFYKTVTSSFKGEGTEAGIAFDNIETALTKFEDGPFFLGQFSLEMNKNEGYTQTRYDPKELVESYKKRFMAHL